MDELCTGLSSIEGNKELLKKMSYISEFHQLWHFIKHISLHLDIKKVERQVAVISTLIPEMSHLKRKRGGRGATWRPSLPITRRYKVSGVMATTGIIASIWRKAGCA